MHIEKIVELAGQFSHRHLFIFESNIHFYQHIRQYSNIDKVSNTTIIIRPLFTEEIRTSILERHQSGGMSYTIREKPGSIIPVHHTDRLFKRIRLVTDGNIGLSFYTWLGLIGEVNENNLLMDVPKIDKFPEILSSGQENLLIQLLLHKKLDLKKLQLVYSCESRDTLNNGITGLYRSGLVIKNKSGNYSVSPYIMPYLIKYLRKKQIIY